jgi:hypothetical protein
MLMELIDDEFEAQLHMNPADFEITMDASSFEYVQMWHDFSQFHVQSCLTMLHDHESTKRNAICLKKIEESFERNFL